MTDETKPKKPIWKRWWLWIIIVFVIIIVIASTGGEKKETKPEQQLSQKQIQDTQQQIKIKTINYTILRKWNPGDNPQAIGMEILIAEEDVSKENIINLVGSIEKDSKKVLIRIFQDKEAWEQEKLGNYGEIYDRGYLVFYVKNLTETGAYRGFNEIRWFQVSGKLEVLMGTVTKIK